MTITYPVPNALTPMIACLALVVLVVFGVRAFTRTLARRRLRRLALARLR